MQCGTLRLPASDTREQIPPVYGWDAQNPTYLSVLDCLSEFLSGSSGEKDGFNWVKESKGMGERGFEDENRKMANERLLKESLRGTATGRPDSSP